MSTIRNAILLSLLFIGAAFVLKIVVTYEVQNFIQHLHLN